MHNGRGEVGRGRGNKGGGGASRSGGGQGAADKAKVPSVDNDTKGKWFPSTTSGKHLKDLVTKGLLPRQQVLWSLASKEHATRAPNSWDCVIHTLFIYRGLSLPLYDFVRGLLRF